MPFYEMPIEWKAPENGINYTRQEFDARIAANYLHLEEQLGKESPLMKIISETMYIALDKIFNGAPN